MNRRVKNIVSLILCAMMLVYALAGCGTAAPAATSTAAAAETTAAAAETTAVAAETTAAASSEAAPAPAGKPYTVKWYTVAGTGPQKNTPHVMEVLNKYLAEKTATNIQVDLQLVDWTFLDKIKLIISSGETFDMCFSAGWWEYQSFVSKGAFLPLNALFAEYAPKTMAKMAPAYKEGPKVNGELYAIPTEKDMAGNFGWVFNKKYVDKYNFDLSTLKSWADITPMLKTIKENEPGIIPLLQGHELSPDAFFERLGGVGVGVTYKYKYDPKVYNQFELPETLAEIRRAHDWYVAGYINEDASTGNNATQPYTKAGNWFAWTQQLKPGKADELAMGFGYPLVQAAICEPFAGTDDTMGAMASISVTSPDKGVSAMKLIELLHTDKFVDNTCKFGVEGEDYVKVSENIIDFPTGVTPASSGYNLSAPWMFGDQGLDFVFTTENPKKWELMTVFNNTAIITPFLGFSFDAVPVKSEIAAAADVLIKYSALIQGTSLDPDATLAKMLAELKAAGSEAIVNEKQKQLDAWLAKKK